jgi:hypothetical protein
MRDAKIGFDANMMQMRDQSSADLNEPTAITAPSRAAGDWAAGNPYLSVSLGIGLSSLPTPLSVDETLSTFITDNGVGLAQRDDPAGVLVSFS